MWKPSMRLKSQVLFSFETLFSLIAVLITTSGTPASAESLEDQCLDAFGQPDWAQGCSSLANSTIYFCPAGLPDGSGILGSAPFMVTCGAAGFWTGSGDLPSWACMYSDAGIGGASLSSSSTPQEIASGAQYDLQCKYWGGYGASSTSNPLDTSACTPVVPTGNFPQCNPSPTPTLSIVPSTVIISQAVNNFTLSGQSNVTLVQGKSAAIIATVTVASPIPNDQTPMTVVATMPDGTTATSSPIPMASIDPDEGVDVTIVPIAVNSSGQGTISLQANAADAISSASVSQTVVVKATNPLGIVYVPLNGTCGAASVTCAGTLRDPAEHMNESTLFIQDTFPVADGKVASQLTSEQGISTLPLGIIWDLEKVLLTRTVTSTSARNGIGIVPSEPTGSDTSGYFAAHDQPAGTRGYTLALSPTYLTSLTGVAAAINPGASLVEEGYWVVTAHEIGHTFGLPDNSSVTGSYVSGYDVANEREIESSPSSPPYEIFYDFMSNKVGVSLFQNLEASWISDLDYGTIFQALLTNPSDPQVLILSGIQQENGSVTLDSAYISSNGIATPYVSTAGNTVNVLNSQGSIVAQASFADSAQLQLISDQGVSSTPSAIPFVIQVPYSSSANTVQILHQGKSILSFNPNSKLLIDALENIPDSSFVKDPSKTRNALLLEAQELEQVMSFCQSEVSARDLFGRKVCSRTIVDGLYDLRGQVVQWLNDSTNKTSSLQMDQADVLHTIDRLILNLMPTNLTVSENGEPIDIDVIMDPDRCEAGLFKVTQITQGEHGSVSVDRNETSVRYTPSSRNPEADQFTYTIADSEGDQVTGTVNLTVPQPPRKSVSILNWLFGG
jgi:hypothetical protein